MAVEVFKDGKSSLIDPEFLNDHLNAGWSVEDPRAETPAQPGIVLLNQSNPLPKLTIAPDTSLSDLSALNPANSKQAAAPIAQIGKAKNAPKRKYTRRASA